LHRQAVAVTNWRPLADLCDQRRPGALGIGLLVLALGVGERIALPDAPLAFTFELHPLALLDDEVGFDLVGGNLDRDLRRAAAARLCLLAGGDATRQQAKWDSEKSDPTWETHVRHGGTCEEGEFLRSTHKGVIVATGDHSPRIVYQTAACG